MKSIKFDYLDNKFAYVTPSNSGDNNYGIELEHFLPTYFEKKSFASYNYKIEDDYAFTKNSEYSEEEMLIKFNKEFISIATNEKLEFGKIGITTELVKNYLKKNKNVILEELQSIGLKNIDNKDIIYAVIHTFAHIDYNLIYPAGPTFALAICGVHNDVELKDYAIQSFEIWNNKSSLDYLKFIKITTPWLKDYLDEVILGIEES